MDLESFCIYHEAYYYVDYFYNESDKVKIVKKVYNRELFFLIEDIYFRNLNLNIQPAFLEEFGEFFAYPIYKFGRNF
jgi:hypothetical protein